MDSDRRVKFYGKFDWAGPHELKKAEKILNVLNSDFVCNSINDALELFNIEKYINSNLSLVEWDAQTCDCYKDAAKVIPSILGKYLNSLDWKNISNYFEALYWQYIDDFWEAFSKYKIYTSVSKSAFAIFLASNKPHIVEILKNKELVKYFDVELKEYLLSDVLNAEILIGKFLSNESENILIPQSVSGEDKKQLIENYINSSDANVNYLSLLAKSFSNTDNSALPLSDEARLMAQKKERAFWDMHFSEHNGLPIGVQVIFESNLTDAVNIENISSTEIKATYSKDWITQNLGFPTLLNNFVYLFGYANLLFVSTFPSYKNQLSTFESMLGVKGNREYSTGIQFSIKEMLSILQMQGYMNVLKSEHISIENIISWFFNNYLPNEFMVSGINFYPPSDGTTIIEKNKLLASNIDGVLKRYKMYVENGTVNEELFLMSSNPETFSSIPSLITQKYAYACSSEILREMNLLFSDQSLLTYTETYKCKYRSAAELYINESVCVDDYINKELVENDIHWLEQRKVLEIIDGVITLSKPRYILLRDLWEYEVICVQRRKNLQSEIENLLKQKDLMIENTLFSKPEQNYLNYILNRREYSNGLDLRNKYIHDSIVRKKEVNETDYIIFLKIWIMIIIKINDELCLTK